ncbi:VPA1267 family protein [Noviherbaspirillum malthae]|uniref:VPA1267 family protein n=1 Tax=Noviherbaspirillum malthae TaxID=1260987 RepID=UPI00188F22F0|nr:VPA1267 family protein [Noviherbaspirillum malthae]
MSEGKNGEQKGQEALQRFKEWIAERDRADDWADYIRGGKLNRTEVAAECQFGTPAFRQNRGIEKELAALEARLRLGAAQEVVDLKRTAKNGSDRDVDADSDRAVAGRLARAKASADQRVKNLEEENAALRAEVAALREKQRQFEHLDAHLAETGRMVHP